MQTLLFLNPEIQEGLNLTVRNGTKWADRVRYGTVLRVAKTGEEDTELGRVLVINAIVIPFVDMEPYPEEDQDVGILQYEHDPSCRTASGLRKVLDEAYPDGIGPQLTMLFFVPWDGS